MQYVFKKNISNYFLLTDSIIGMAECGTKEYSPIEAKPEYDLPQSLWGKCQLSTVHVIIKNNYDTVVSLLIVVCACTM